MNPSSKSLKNSVVWVIAFSIWNAPVNSRSEEVFHQVSVSDICNWIQIEAEASKIPKGFFARLIWKESRFDTNAISPKGAEGIAQFMPGTARVRGLENSFDPKSAIQASAGLLSDLRYELGNLGLAAAAYNAGLDRVNRWRAGRASLPLETRDYVKSITGYHADKWKRNSNLPAAKFSLDEALPFLDACEQFLVIRAPLQSRFAATYYNRALSHAKDRNYTKAIQNYTVAIRLKPDFPYAYNNRGLVYRKIGDYRRAIENYTVALSQNPKYAAGYNNRGYARRKLRQFKEAIVDYDAALNLKPSYAAARFNRGFAMAKLGRMKEAISDYSQVLQINKKHSLAFYNRGLAQLSLGKLVEAEADFSSAIVANSKNSKAYFQRAKLRLGRGNKGLAMQDYRISVELNSVFGNKRYKDIFK